MEDPIKGIIARLYGIKGWSEFIVSYDFGNKDGKPIITMLSKFREYRNSIEPLSQEEIYLLDFIQSKMFEYCYEHNSQQLFYFDKTQTLGNEILEEFRQDWNHSKTNRYCFVDNPVQTYKTWTEFTKYEEHKDNGISYKYKDAYHPLIYSTIGKSFINGGYISFGVPFIMKAFHYANNPNNPFWHSPYGIFGCAEAIWEYIRLLGVQNIKTKYSNYELLLFKLLFLYLSRAIAASHTEKLLQGMDFYRNRANIVLKQYTIFMSVFIESNFIANMQIQYISDTYLGYKLCSDLGVSYIGDELLRDSRKMYTNGSLNSIYDDNGYKYIEDAGWLELVERGRVRSNKVAENLILQMKEGKLSIPVDKLNSMIYDIIKEHKEDSIKNYDWKQ